jgi:hypothetical protein
MTARRLATLALVAGLIAAGAPSAARAVPGMPAGLSAIADAAVLAGERAAVARLDARRAEVADERAGLEGALDDLSARIVELKSRRRLFGDAELTRALQASRDLSARIDRLAREEERLTAELSNAARRLAEGYDRLVAETRRQMASLPTGEGEEGAARRAHLERLAALEAERAAVQDGIARLERGGLDAEEILPGVALSRRVARDDPEELRAQADIIRDTRDRLERRLEEVDRKAKRIREQRALEREMDGFLAETRLFDEGDRAAVRFGSGERPVAGRGVDVALGGGDAEAAAAPADESFDGDGADPSFDVGLEDSAPGEAPPPDDSGGTSPEAGRQTFDGTATGGETLFELDRITTRAEASAALDALLSYDGGGSLEDLEAYREEIERLIRRLERRADGLERRADTLDRRR